MRFWSLLLPDGYAGPIQTLGIGDDGMLAVEYHEDVPVTVHYNEPGYGTPVMCRELFIKADGFTKDS